jgi:hypothetical protein
LASLRRLPSQRHAGIPDAGSARDEESPSPFDAAVLDEIAEHGGVSGFGGRANATGVAELDEAYRSLRHMGSDQKNYGTAGKAYPAIRKS